MMKITFVLRDKKNTLRLSVKTMDSFIERLKNDTKDRAVARRRESIALTGSAQNHDNLYPSHRIFPSAVFEKDANDNLRLRTFNGVVALTVGGLLRKADIEAVKQAAGILHYTLAAFAGPDGNEVIILVHIAKSDAPTEDTITEEEADTLCRQGYQLAVSLYQGILPKPIRREEIMLHSSFHMPLDPSPYYNPNAVALNVGKMSIADRPRIEQHTEVQQMGNTDSQLYAEYERLYRRASDVAYEMTEGLPEDERLQAYLTETAHQLFLMDVPEEEAAIHIRNHHFFKRDFNQQEMRTIVETVYAEEKHGKKAAEPTMEIGRETQRLLSFLNTRYQFRYNTIMGYTEYRPNHTYYGDWKPIDDRALKGLTLEVRLYGIDARDNDVRRYVQSNKIHPYDPIGDYLWSLHDKWDGKDHIRQLARTVPTKNPHWEDWFYTWFLGMVRQWQVSDLAKYGNQSMPLLISTQGWNKTTFCEQLLPPELSWGYTGNQLISDKKQVLQQMAQMLLINFDEFNQISPQIQQGFLKNIITLSSVKIKRPYGRHVENFPRRASFIAATNQPDVLADPSGSRRFLGVELTGSIDVSTPPNHQQLYAQAMQALSRHEPYYFGPAETKVIVESNRRFSVKTAAEQFFLDYFEPATDESEGQWMSASAIFEYLKSKVGISLLKPANVAAFGRQLSSIPRLKKRVTSSNSEYFVRLLPSTTLLPPSVKYNK